MLRKYDIIGILKKKEKYLSYSNNSYVVPHYFAYQMMCIYHSMLIDI